MVRGASLAILGRAFGDAADAPGIG